MYSLIPDDIKVAIVHDWLVTQAGAEKVLESLLKLFPRADLYTLIEFLPDHQRGLIEGRKVKTSFLQKLPFAKKKYRTYLPFMPLAIEQFDLSAYQIILSCSSAVAKGVLVGPDQLHICYIYSPIRYAWDLQHQYLQQTFPNNGPGSWIARLILHYLRIWDLRTANSVDYFVAISDFIARRVVKTYRRDSTVIYPPVNIDAFGLQSEKSDYYVTAQRMVPYKRIDIIINAFKLLPNLKLLVIGDGPDREKLQRNAGENVTFTGFLEESVLINKLQNAKAFIFAAEEDFGITPLEAQACGTPVIAYGKGGSRETIIHGKTGVLFEEQTETSLLAAIQLFESMRGQFDPQVLRANAARFSQQVFNEKMMAFIKEKYDAFCVAST